MSSDLEIVLDVDETLIHCYHDNFKFQNVVLTPGDVLLHEKVNQSLRAVIFQINVLDFGYNAGTGVNSIMHGIKRPHLDIFLRFNNLFFAKQVLYSAGQEPYVTALASQIYGRHLFMPTAVYNFDQIVRIDQETRKPFEKLKKHIDPNRAFIIDDQLPAIKYNNGRGIHIPMWKPDINKVAREYQQDHYLLIIVIWFLDRPNMNSEYLELPTQEFLIKENELWIKEPDKVSQALSRFQQYELQRLTTTTN